MELGFTILRVIEMNWLKENAVKAVASTYGILVGLASIEHGIFEILQGDTPTGGIMIDAIGDDIRFWEDYPQFPLDRDSCSILRNYSDHLGFRFCAEEIWS
jgi:hypothetical protein